MVSVCLGSFLAFAALPARAQSPDATAPPASAKPAAGQTDAPSDTAREKKKPKKVWTNEDMGSVKGSVSVVGEANAPSDGRGVETSMQARAAANVRQQQMENYRHQLQQYQGQIDAIDKRITQLKNFKAEDTSPSGGIKMHQGYNMVPIEDQVKQLEKQKKQLQARMEDTENEARKNGIDSGDLR
jgi:hypothetical protein